MRRPKFKEVVSSNLHYVWYGRKSRQLHIIFHSGSYYVYNNVSYYRYWKLIKAESLGRYFYYNIRMNYIYKRLR